MSQSESWTIGRLLTWTTDYLKQQGSDSPRLDAEVLLATARGCKRIDLYTAFAEIADDPTRTAFRELVRRRAEGTPVAYLVGQREFFSLSFRVTPDVLIPRPETETLVVRLLDLAESDFKTLSPGGRGEGEGESHYKSAPSPQPSPIQGEGVHIADIGTGSGIIAICAAKHLPTAHITAVDASAAALEVARQNAAAHHVADRIEFIVSDLLSALPSEQKFNLIASNPPYVSEAEFATLSPSVRNFEPRQALVAGPRGTEVIQRLVPQAADRLESGGWLLLEVSPMIEPAVREIISQHGGFELGPTLKDSASHPRVVQAKKS
ncbi:MAG TPA: peptide chain release factor N(5)-glutamine methyltransferase [Pirellulales bacterium]|jgi:release factor glutamine methyltransferase|nr:peptide chain release factor N(5)-glutamine methyltransferase [Pirellulales bacterium]